MFCNHYQSFDLSKKGQFQKFKKEMYEMNLEYGKPQSKFIVGPEDYPFVINYSWYVYDQTIDIHEIFTIVVYKSNLLKGGVFSETKQMD